MAKHDSTPTPASDSGLRCAVYARKSTDDNDRHEENKSVTRQIEHARKYAERKGWTVADQHVYVDDGVSGAEFKRRPGLLRMLDHLKEFDCIVMSELSRLGREQTQTSGVLATIYAKERRIFFYLNDEELRFKSAVDKFMVNAVSFGAELEREKAAQRARDALDRRAERGFNPGGACFGYENVQVFGNGMNGDRVKSHTDYRIHKAEAEVVRGIFRAYADGYGHTVIAKSMNGNASGYGRKGKRRRTQPTDFADIRKRYFAGKTPPPPQRGKRGTGSWAPSMIREVLYRERYTGVVPFADRMTERPDLRIVDAELWDRVQKRLKGVRETYIREGGQWWGRPSTEKYLLTGMGRCSCCGKSIATLGGYNGSPRRKKIYYYGCSYQHTRGSAVCANDHRARMEWLDAGVIEAIERQVFKPEAIAAVVETAAAAIERELRKNPDRPRELEAEARKLRRELDRFLRLIAEGRAPDSVLVEIRRREERLKQIESERAALVEAPPTWTPAQIRSMCGDRLRRFPELLHANVPVARQALRKLFTEPLRMSPASFEGRKTLRFEGQTVLGPLFDPAYKGLASPRGFEPRLLP